MKKHPLRDLPKQRETKPEGPVNGSGSDTDADQDGQQIVQGLGEDFGQKLGQKISEEPAEPSLEEQLVEATTAAAANYDRFLRASAELDNVRKRQERELSERAKYAAEPLARDLLCIVDDLERALEFAEGPGGGVADGVKLVLKSVSATLAKYGVARVESVGATFDPAVHEAVATVESAEAEPNTVIEEHRAGYMFKDRLLRAAMVVVSRAPGETAG